MRVRTRGSFWWSMRRGVLNSLCHSGVKGGLGYQRLPTTLCSSTYTDSMIDQRLRAKALGAAVPDILSSSMSTLSFSSYSRRGTKHTRNSVYFLMSSELISKLLFYASDVLCSRLYSYRVRQANGDLARPNA